MKIKGIANWACVQTPNVKFEPTYQIDVTIDAKQAKEVKATGISVKETDDGEFIVKLRRKQFKKDGSENKKPRVVDAHKQPFEGLIGNGSLVNVIFNVFEWKNNFGAGISADLRGVQVLELVEYGDDEDFEEEDGGFVQQTNNNEDDDLPFDDE